TISTFGTCCRWSRCRTGTWGTEATLIATGVLRTVWSCEVAFSTLRSRTGGAATSVWHSPSFFFSSRRRHTRFDCDWSRRVLFRSHDGLPFIVQQHGGNPAVMAALGMLAGYCGTLCTPMAANFNLVPAILLELNDKHAVIKAQLPRSEERRVGKECRSQRTDDQ